MPLPRRASGSCCSSGAGGTPGSGTTGTPAWCGAAWPLSYEDFEPWYTKAERLYSVHGERGADPLDPPASAGYPWPAVSHEPRIEQLAHDLKGAGLHPFPLPLGILSEP